MIGILHGYLLEGSGSNLWTRSIIQALCRQGEIVHLFCQENHPEIYDFISAAYLYESPEKVTTIFERKVDYPGRCLMHKPQLGKTLPVYVWDHYEEFPNVVPMVELPDEQVAAYLTTNIEIISKVINDRGITVLHANHAVLMSVVAHRIEQQLGIPFAIMPHGSAIEYAVKKDKRFYNFAQAAFDAAKKLFVIGPEIHQRVRNLFTELPNIDKKMVELNLGADTGLFEPINKNQRKANISQLNEALKGLERGKAADLSNRLLENLHGDMGKEELLQAITDSADYTAKHPDNDVEEKLLEIDWEQEKIILFVGRMIISKGLQSIVAALPQILAREPEARLVIVGHGPQREVLEALLWALRNGEKTLVDNIIKWGSYLEGSETRPYSTVQSYLTTLSDKAQYFKNAQDYLTPDRVVFTGYLTHRELRYLFPCCDVSIFPSVVAEAGPLVFLEALAAGSFPLGTYFAGMAASINSVQPVLEAGDVETMKITPDENNTVADIAQKVPDALKIAEKYKSDLRKIAVERYDWRNVGKKLLNELNEMVTAE